MQEIKAGDHARIRGLFERAITLQLPPKKMKVCAGRGGCVRTTLYTPQFFFKRYLEFETQHGTEERVEEVKRKAVEYVQNVVAV